MTRNTAGHKPLESSSTLNRLPHLADSLLHFNLSDELRCLRDEDSWARGTGLGSKTLAKYPDFRIVLVLMKPGSEMKEHHADARISIQNIQGRIRLQLPDRALELGTGELMYLESGIAHDVSNRGKCVPYNSVLAGRKCRGATRDQLIAGSIKLDQQRMLLWLLKGFL